MESEIKIGQQFEFAIHADNRFRQKAVVTRVLSNREEGIGPEADYYIADWIEARTLSEQPKALVFSSCKRRKGLFGWRAGRHHRGPCRVAVAGSA